MQKLIYYPNFEPSSLNWLKYALLYQENFSPIIPVSGDTEVSEIFKRVSSETDLVEPFRPTWDQGHDASTNVMNEVDMILSHPERYRDVFNKVNIARTFTDPNQWTVKLYDEKYSQEFLYFCITHNLGSEIDGGVLLSEDLANLFMIHLVDVIAYKTGAQPITDLKDLDSMVNFFRLKNNEISSFIETAQATIDIKLPAKIEEVELSEIIKFRNASGNSELRRSYNQSLYSFLENLEGEMPDPKKYLAALNNSGKELTHEIALLLGGLVSAGLGATILMTSDSSDYLEIGKEVVEGITLVAGGGYAVRKSWILDGRKPARKYLTSLSGIKSSRNREFMVLEVGGEIPPDPSKERA